MNFKRLARGPILWVVLAAVLILLAFSTLRVPSTQAIDTSDGLALLAARPTTVEQVKMTDGVQRVDMTLSQNFTKNGKDYGKSVQFFYIAPQGQNIVNAVTAANPAQGFNSINPQTSWWSSLLGLLLPFVIILGLFW